MTPDAAAIASLVAQLDSLHDGETVALRLIAAGDAAIPHLRRFLLEGEPGTIFQPRQWAVEILGALGAKDVLLEYLRRPRAYSNAAVAYAEEAVEITAARELKRWRSDDVFEALFGVLNDHLQRGAIEALGELRRPESVPRLIEALEDGVCGTAAERALRMIGAAARDALLAAAIRVDPDSETETSSSLLRRESALRLLVAIGISSEQWRSIAATLDPSNPRIAVALAWLALQAGSDDDRRAWARRLEEIRPRAHWLVQADIDDCLRALARTAHRLSPRSF